jgi:hypothetical protein
VAERERRAKLTGAEAEFQAAARLAEAAAALKVPAAYLRWLTMLERVGRLDMRAEIVGPSMVPDPKPVAKPVDSKVAAGLRAIRNQKRGEEWVGAALGGAGRP